MARRIAANDGAPADTTNIGSVIVRSAATLEVSAPSLAISGTTIIRNRGTLSGQSSPGFDVNGMELGANTVMMAESSIEGDIGNNAGTLNAQGTIFGTLANSTPARPTALPIWFTSAISTTTARSTSSGRLLPHRRSDQQRRQR